MGRLQPGRRPARHGSTTASSSIRPVARWPDRNPGPDHARTPAHPVPEASRCQQSTPRSAARARRDARRNRRRPPSAPATATLGIRRRSGGRPRASGGAARRAAAPSPAQTGPDRDERSDGLRAWLADWTASSASEPTSAPRSPCSPWRRRPSRSSSRLLRQDAATKDDLDSLRDQLSSVEQSATRAAQTGVRSLNQRLADLRARSTALDRPDDHQARAQGGPGRHQGAPQPGLRRRRHVRRGDRQRDGHRARRPGTGTGTGGGGGHRHGDVPAPAARAANRRAAQALCGQVL